MEFQHTVFTNNLWFQDEYACDVNFSREFQNTMHSEREPKLCTRAKALSRTCHMHSKTLKTMCDLAIQTMCGVWHSVA